MPLQNIVNFSKTTNFRFWCPELPLVSELIQDVTIPSMMLNPAEVPNRFVDFGQPGEKIVFTELDCGFIMDENYDAYAEIYSWMTRMAGAPDIHIKESQRGVLFCDTEIIMLDNSQRETRRFIFHDSWPTALGAVAIDTSGESVSVKSVLTMQYTAMSIRPDEKNLTGLDEFAYNH